MHKVEKRVNHAIITRLKRLTPLFNRLVRTTDISQLFSFKKLAHITTAFSLVPIASFGLLTAQASVRTPSEMVAQTTDPEAVVTVTPNSKSIAVGTTANATQAISDDTSAITGDVIVRGGALVALNSANPSSSTTENTAANTSSARDGIVIHEINGGETLTSIAKQYGLSPMTMIYESNYREDIHPGEFLSVPPADGVIHTVKSGQTLGEIVKQYGVDTTAKTITDNRLDENGTVHVDDRIFVRDGKRAKLVPKPVAGGTGISSRNGSTFGPVSESSGNTQGSGSMILPISYKQQSRCLTASHAGCDWTANVGTSITAADGGTVTYAGWRGGYGNVIFISHGNGLETRYAHLSQINVRVGQSVSQGQEIAKSGNTGYSTGPHLHFEVRNNGVAQNPWNYVGR